MSRLKITNQNSGLTLVEILVIIAILTAMAAQLTPKIVNFYNNYELDANAQELVQVVHLSQQRAMQSENSSAYSIHFVSGSGGSFTLYRGTNYATRDTSYDEVHNLISSLSLSYAIATSSNDINFSKIEGITGNTGSITISWPDGNLSKTITVNPYGVVERQ